MRPPIPPAGAAGETRVDLHLHSRASTDTGSWFLSRALLPESYTDPEVAYATAKRRGMDVVALTDHNTVSGAMEIAHHPDVVVGVEVTATFPEDRVPVHVLVWGVDEARWADLDRLRPNLYELLDHAEAEGLPHALAHPLHRVGDRLGPDHIERCLLLFRLWEGRNGSRPRALNEAAVRIARSAGPEYLARLAEKHGISPRQQGPPGLVGGSDDHGSYDIGATWTVTPAADGPAALLGHLRSGRVRPGGAHGSADGLAHSVGTLALKAAMDGGALAIPEGLRGIVSDLVRHPCPPSAEAARNSSAGARVAEAVRSDRRLVRRYRRLGRAPEGAARSHARLRLAAGWLHGEMLRSALEPAGARPGALGARGQALLMAAAAALPYLLAAHYDRGEERFAEAMEREFFGEPLTGPRAVPVLMVTDTYGELNGVAGTMRRLAEHAASRPGFGITVVTCGAGGSEPGRRDLEPVARLPVPAYGDPGWALGVPSVIDVLALARETGARVLHAATPGPAGLAAMVVARALRLPFATTHHTELARYVLDLTGDRLAGDLADRAVRWFHGRADRVYVPTRATGEGLAAAGIDPGRIVRFGRGVDLALFGPGRRSRRMRRRLGGDGVIVLYVGRLSREKGLSLLAEAFRRAHAHRPDLRLAVVGEGPGRAGLEDALRGTPHRLVGALHGRELAEAYASADVFCLPSATETFGQVTLEAAASALPAVVLDRGAAAEQVTHGETGLVCPAGDPDALAARLALLCDDPGLRARMGAAARARAEAAPSWDEVFDGLATGYAELVGPPGRAGAAAVAGTAA